MLTLVCCLDNIDFGGGVRIDVGAESLEVIYDAAFSSADCVFELRKGRRGGGFVFEGGDSVCYDLSSWTAVALGAGYCSWGRGARKTLDMR
jgi:hypothetical protein